MIVLHVRTNFPPLGGARVEPLSSSPLLWQGLGELCNSFMVYYPHSSVDPYLPNTFSSGQCQLFLTFLASLSHELLVMPFVSILL